MTTISFEPLRVAKYLQLVKDQRTRTLTKFQQEYGHDHPIVKSLMAEIAELLLEINEQIKAQAVEPTLKKTK
jgi:hypothetical protein